MRAKAPLRLGLAGGGTDVSPYSDVYGGHVLNATIDMYAYCTIETSAEVAFEAKDLGERWEGALGDPFSLDDGHLRLHKAVYNRVTRDFLNGHPPGVRVTTMSDAPAGSGLGSSSTMVVAMLRAYQQLLGLPLGDYDLAHLAFEIERNDCGLAGGKQDQYAATFGGFNFIEFYSNDKVVVNPLRVREEIINELEAHLMLYYTGRSRSSAKIIEDQIQTAKRGDLHALEAMHQVKLSATHMKEALLRGQVRRMVDILAEGWSAKKGTSRSITNPLVERVLGTAVEAGALAAKLSGAGGGGFLMIFVEPTRRLDVQRALLNLGDSGAVFRFHFTREGTQAWVA